MELAPKPGCLGKIFGRRPRLTDPVDAVLSDISESVRRRQLEKWVYPPAGQILEACALHYSRIVKHAPAGSSAPQASLAAFREAVRICGPMLWRRSPRSWLEGLLSGGFRSADSRAWNKVLGDFLEGDIDDAVRRASNLLRGEPDRERLDMDSLPRELQPAYDIALKLKHLAYEVEAGRSRQVATSATSGLDDALRELGEIRRAERELDSETRLRQGN
jgi:hypothetical protein